MHIHIYVNVHAFVHKQQTDSEQKNRTAAAALTKPNIQTKQKYSVYTSDYTTLLLLCMLIEYFGYGQEHNEKKKNYRHAYIKITLIPSEYFCMCLQHKEMDGNKLFPSIFFS